MTAGSIVSMSGGDGGAVTAIVACVVETAAQ